MIPPIISPDTAPGERLVFERLASDPATSDWVVLHSLEIAHHVRQVQGEADFVVIVPRKGIVVIEVKSHQRIARLPDGQWALGNDRPTAHGPFKQASDAMHSIRSYLVSREVDLTNVPILYAVWFTHVRARATLAKGLEWQSWQLLDRDDITRTGAAILDLVAQGTRHLHSRTRVASENPTKPPLSDVHRLVSALRPRFELGAGTADVRREREVQLSAFLDDQYDALDSMHDHRSVLFTGPAGCGKTFLALESARREGAMHHDGRLICFNRALGQHLASLNSSPSLEIANLHALMVRITGLPVPPEPRAEFWTHTLVDAALERLLEGDLAGDYLIVDEAQDLTQDSYLDVLDLLVRGGLAGGRCLLFGDFERQALYGLDDGRERLAERIPDLVRFSLSSNCRNLPRIGHVAQILTDMQPGYRRFRRTDDGAKPRYLWYSEPEEREPLLLKAIKYLRDDGFELQDIVVLAGRWGNSVISNCSDPWLRKHLAKEEGTKPHKNRIRYSTVHAFKGLEAPAVILMDIDNAGSPEFDAVLYVGLTRPTDRLTVISTREALQDRALKI